GPRRRGRLPPQAHRPRLVGRGGAPRPEERPRAGEAERGGAPRRARGPGARRERPQQAPGHRDARELHGPRAHARAVRGAPRAGGVPPHPRRADGGHLVRPRGHANVAETPNRTAGRMESPMGLSEIADAHYLHEYYGYPRGEGGMTPEQRLRIGKAVLIVA